MKPKKLAAVKFHVGRYDLMEDGTIRNHAGEDK